MYYNKSGREYEISQGKDENFIMSPKIDFAFKLIFGDQNNIDLLQELLSAILELEPDDLQDLTIINNELLKNSKEDKKGILDIRAKTKDRQEVNIEIQLSPTKYMAERTVYYWAKMYIGQIKAGDAYDRLNKCITINILDFECTPANKLHTKYHIIEDQEGYKLTDVLEIHYLELPKLGNNNATEENRKMIEWMEFIAADSREVMSMLAEKNKKIEKAFKVLEVISKDDKARMAYEAREMAIHDQVTREKEANERGREEGEEKKAIEIAIKLLRSGADEEGVVELTGLTKEKIEELKINM